MSENKVINILISSVGGQGGLTLSRIIALSAVISGYHVKTGETLGMAQRFGSVVSYVRVGIGKEVYSPLFDFNEAHYVVCMEVLECARTLRYLHDEGVLILDNTIKPPTSMSLAGKNTALKEQIIKQITEVVRPEKVVVVPARDIASSMGDPRGANMVLLGVLNKISKIFTDEEIEEAISNFFKGRARELSLRAYKEGFKYLTS
ncbi:MAG: 2-oxoacid:acceptor oxidoreductase family protein [Thermoprotei archaeon]